MNYPYIIIKINILIYLSEVKIQDFWHTRYQVKKYILLTNSNRHLNGKIFI